MRSLLTLSLVITLSIFAPYANAGFYDDLSCTSDNESSWLNNTDSWGDQSSTSDYESSRENNPFVVWIPIKGSTSTGWNDIDTSSGWNDSLCQFSVKTPAQLQITYTRALTNIYSRIDIAACGSMASKKLKEQALSLMKRNFKLLEEQLTQYNEDYAKENLQTINHIEEHFNQLLDNIEIQLLNHERDQLAICAENQCYCSLLERHLSLNALHYGFHRDREAVWHHGLLKPSSLQAIFRRTEAFALRRIAAPLCNSQEAKNNLAKIKITVEAALIDLAFSATEYESKHRKSTDKDLRAIQDSFLTARYRIAEKLKRYEEEAIASNRTNRK